MSYSSDSFLKPIGSDKNIKFYDNTGSLTYTVKPTFITDVIDEVNLLRVILKSSKEIKLDFINTDEPILAKSILLEQISTLLQTNDYVDNSQPVVGYTTAPYSYDTFLRPLAQSDRNIKILGIDLVVKYTIDPFTINNTNVSGNLIRINLKSNRIITLEFSTSNEAKLAHIRLREQIDILTLKTPFLIDKDVQNYVTNVIDTLTSTIESHASRHLPNGLDPLVTGTPSTINTINQEGIRNAFARQDHIHAHGDQPGGTLHATASHISAGFMSSTDKINLDNLKAMKPSLPDVLKISDRIYQEASPQSGSTYTFEIDDRWKDSTMQSGGAVTDIILDDDAFLFPNNSVIMFRVYDTPALLNYTAGTDVRYLGASATADIPIEVGDDCRLKKTDGIWELIISNKSTSQNLAQVLAIDNKTNDIPIVSNNGKAVVDVNDDYLQIGYDGGGGSSNISFEDIQTTIVGLIATNIYAGTQIQVNAGEYIGISAPAVDIDTPILNYNSEEVATQDWVTSHYGTGTVTSVTGDLVDNTDPNNPVINTPIDKFSFQVTQSGTSAPVIVTGSLKGNFGATITPSYSSAGVYFFTASLPIFANIKDAYKQLSTIPTSLLSGANFFTLGYFTFVVISDTEALLSVYNDIFAPGVTADNLITEPLLLELPYNSKL